jgi:hypothetical protein
LRPYSSASGQDLLQKGANLLANREIWFGLVLARRNKRIQHERILIARLKHPFFALPKLS